MLVPADSKVVATVAVTKTTLSRPYTLSGDYVYASGARRRGTNGGTFTGVNSHDLEGHADAVQLDGTPAAKPVPQPGALPPGRATSAATAGGIVARSGLRWR